MESFEIVLRAWITILALTLFILSFLAYGRERTQRLKIVAALFGVFTIKGILLTAGIFFESLGNVVDNTWFFGGFDVIVLLLLLLVAWGKKKRTPPPFPEE